MMFEVEVALGLSECGHKENNVTAPFFLLGSITERIPVTEKKRGRAEGGNS